MSKEKLPKWFVSLKEKYGDFIGAVEKLGKITHETGPLDEKTAHLIQLAAAATMQSEGSVHSHVKRALDAGAKPEEICHAVILLTSTIGFPKVSASLSWINDVLQDY